MPNEHRKVLARAYARILDEQATTTMSDVQQAFLRGRDITSANVSIAESYYRGVERSLLRFWLLLDCSKGYNYLSLSWLERVLRHADAPNPITTAIMHLVKHGSAVTLALQSHTCRPLSLASGLAQGCPLSCVLYVIAVDPFLEFLSKRIRNVEIVVGFCDDWTVECSTADAILNVQCLGEEFERASGQRFNRDKTKLLPTRPLQNTE
eukprot:6656432-Karenia_brevis.AAC.1